MRKGPAEHHGGGQRPKQQPLAPIQVGQGKIHALHHLAHKTSAELAQAVDSGEDHSYGGGGGTRPAEHGGAEHALHDRELAHKQAVAFSNEMGAKEFPCCLN